jgi:hypothetical protein
LDAASAMHRSACSWATRVVSCAWSWATTRIEAVCSPIRSIS